MSTTRFFNGGREPGKRSVASEMMRFEIMKKGKLQPGERYKRILKKKFEQSQQKAIMDLGGKRTMSKKAEQALKDVAARKAAKQAKAERMMVIIQPRNYSTGQLSRNGNISDLAGNVIGKVDKKTGKIATNGGWGLGRYKAKSFMTDLAIQEGINKFSPYFINLRKMQMMQQGDVGGAGGGVWGNPATDTINVHGAAKFSSDSAYGYASDGSGLFGSFGSDVTGPRQNIGVTGWGAMSDNVWGTFSDNAWGVSTDNVWGGNSSDIWGGIGGNPWGNFAKTVRIWGSGNGHNYLKGLGNKVAAFFGLNIKSKASRAAFRESVGRVRSSRSSSSGGTARAATTTRTR